MLTTEGLQATPLNWLPPYVKPQRIATSTPNFDIIHTYLHMTLVPKEVLELGGMFGHLPHIKLDDNDLGNLDDFPSLVWEKYLERVLEDDVLKVEPMPWVK